MTGRRRRRVPAGRPWSVCAALLLAVTVGCGEPPPSATDTLADALAETPARETPLLGSSGAFANRLPATFTCADCGGLRYHLNLLPNHSFFLRRTDPIGVATDVIGTWALTRARSAVVLTSQGSSVEQWLVGDDGTLRFTASGPALSREASFRPLEMRLNLRGLFSLSGSDRRFEECLTGQPWTVESSPELDTRYAFVGPPAGGRVLMDVEGRVLVGAASGRVVPRLIVDRVLDVELTDTCAPPGSTRSLAGTTWSLTEVFGQRVTDDGERHPWLEFHGQDFTASDGCNRFVGSYRQDGVRLEFNVSIATVDACPGLGVSGESFRAALVRVRSRRSVGDTLALLDADGILVARFAARR